FTPFNVPALPRGPDGPRDVYRVVSSPVCLDMGNVGWIDVRDVLHANGRIAARIDNFRAFTASITIYAGADHELRPAVIAQAGRGTPSLAADVFARGDAAAERRLAAAAATDRLTIPESIRQAPYIIRANVRVNDNGYSSSFTLDLGGNVVDAVGSAA